MTRRELGERYAGQILGTAWAVGHPLIMMAVYVFIFAVVFKIKVGGTLALPLDYTTYLLSGLVPWMTFQESLGKATTAISSNAALVKQVVFPLEILPIKGVLTSLISMGISTAILIIYTLLRHGYLHWTVALLPLLIIFQVMAMTGVAFILSAVGAFLRDVKDMVLVFTIINLYLVPIFYLPTMVPSIFRPILYLNPFSYMIWCYQDALYFGRFEHPWAWWIFGILSLSTLHFGYLAFNKLKNMFGNVL